jgi:hypothetical protein
MQAGTESRNNLRYFCRVSEQTTIKGTLTYFAGPESNRCRDVMMMINVWEPLGTPMDHFPKWQRFCKELPNQCSGQNIYLPLTVTPRGRREARIAGEVGGRGGEGVPVLTHERHVFQLRGVKGSKVWPIPYCDKNGHLSGCFELRLLKTTKNLLIPRI